MTSVLVIRFVFSWICVFNFVSTNLVLFFNLFLFQLDGSRLLTRVAAKHSAYVIACGFVFDNVRTNMCALVFFV